MFRNRRSIPVIVVISVIGLLTLYFNGNSRYVEPQVDENLKEYLREGWDLDQGRIEHLERQKLLKNEALYNHNSTVVLLMAYYRSGSSFTGELFNRNPDVFYLYEPLYTFTPRCETLYEERLDMLSEISRCDFRKVSQRMRKGKLIKYNG